MKKLILIALCAFAVTIIAVGEVAARRTRPTPTAPAPTSTAPAPTGSATTSTEPTTTSASTTPAFNWGLAGRTLVRSAGIYPVSCDYHSDNSYSVIASSWAYPPPSVAPVFDAIGSSVMLPGPLLREIFEIKGRVVLAPPPPPSPGSPIPVLSCPEKVTVKFRFLDGGNGTYGPILTKEVSRGVGSACAFEFKLGTDDLNWDQFFYDPQSGYRVFLRYSFMFDNPTVTNPTVQLGFHTKGEFEELHDGGSAPPYVVCTTDPLSSNTSSGAWGF